MGVIGNGSGVLIARRGLLGLAAACVVSAAGEVWSDRSRPDGVRAGVKAGVAGGVPAAVRTAGPGQWLAADPRALVALDGTGGRLAMTFDDGPDPAYTPSVLDLLARYEVPATFFVIGRNVVAHPELVARMRAEGHLVANHTRDHVWLDRLPRSAVEAQVDGGAADCAAVGARGDALLRVPHGWTSSTVATVTRDRRVRSVFWTVCLEAHLRAGPRHAVARMSSHVVAGAIVLCHDGGHLDGPNPQSIDRSATVEALPDLLKLIHRRGLTPVTLAWA